LRPFEWAEICAAPGEEFADPDGLGPAGPASDDGAVDAQPGEPTAEELAEAVLEEASAQAERLLDEARTRAEALAEEARRRGFEAGEAEGREHLARAAEGLEALASELAGYKPSLYRDARSHVLELVLALVNKILGPLAESEGAPVVRVVERALQLLTDRETLTIRVHPEDLHALLEAKPKILETFDGIKGLTVVEDPSVKRGGCLVETPTTEIDARLDTQLQEVARSMRAP
jgi:flagellar assembly protein FliH